MTLTIGRFTSPSEVKRVSLSGDTVELTFDLDGTDADHLKALQQQLNGLVGNEDEEVVPVTWSLDSTFDGFYRVRAADAGDSQLMFARKHWHEASVTLERVTGYANPWFEVITQSVVRTNAHAFTVPPSVVQTYLQNTSTQVHEMDAPTLTLATAISRTTADSATAISAATIAAPLAATSYRFATPADLFYVGGCKIEVKYGSTWYPVIGRNFKRSTAWRITNGLVRLCSQDGATDGTIDVWNGSAWEVSTALRHTNGSTLGFGIGLGEPTSDFQPSVSVLRNSPEQVTVRVSWSTSLAFTYVIQRGAMFVVAGWTSAASDDLGIAFSSATACTAITGGMRVTSNDANGNRLVFSLPVALTTDLVNGKIYPSANATSGQQMIGVELNGSSAASGNAAADLVNQFMGATSWRQRIVVQ